jgi:hypothetical protein
MPACVLGWCHPRQPLNVGWPLQHHADGLDDGCSRLSNLNLLILLTFFAFGAPDSPRLLGENSGRKVGGPEF